MKVKEKLLTCVLIILLSVVTGSLLAPDISFSKDLKIENSLPPEELAQYNDSFDKLREDLWDKGGWARSETIKSNFKYADMTVHEGQLRIQTKTGAFSKGALASKYSLKGDFDIQIDCHVELMQDIDEMDQQAGFAVVKKGATEKDMRMVMIFVRRLVTMRGTFSGMDTISFNGRDFKLEKRHNADKFHGALRIVRVGDKATTLYKREGQDQWTEMCRISFTKEDVFLGFLVQNFKQSDTSIKATVPFAASFDNFKINGAQEIIEEDI